MCGLPASGKTTTAERLHAAAGGVLIRSCDVYRELGISLPEWVRVTEGFTRSAKAYEEARDTAHLSMLSRLEEQVTAGTRLVIMDAVHGEIAKRRAIFDLCAAHDYDPLLLWCRCDDRHEIERRLSLRRGRESEPECEASDWAVVDHLKGLWDDPADERGGMDSGPVLCYDTHRARLHWMRPVPRSVRELVDRALPHGAGTSAALEGEDAASL
jgi:predicted kinase